VWHRLLFAIDQYESGQTALRFTSEIAGGIDAQVSVIHVREISKWARVPPLETPAEAEFLVQEAILNLQLAGVRADGIACSAPEDLVA
jgi:nucleotide-binding universal stress UspA family protein